MRIAITGGTGFVGRYIVNELTATGHTCRCWHRPTSDRGGFTHREQIEWVAGDLEESASCVELVRDCEAVVHAALDRPGNSFRGGEGNLIDFAERNILGTLRLIEAARAAGVLRFVLISTCAVHERILDDRPLDESHPLWPTSHYGAHKAALEAFVHSYGLGDAFPICALRPCGVYGLARPASESKWFGLIRAVVAGEPVACQGGGKEVHASDVARAVQLLLQSAQVAGEAFNCCDQYISQWQVAHIAKELAGHGGQISGQAKRSKHQIETGKLQRLGMTFGGETLLRETIRQLVDAVKST